MAKDLAKNSAKPEVKRSRRAEAKDTTSRDEALSDEVLRTISGGGGPPPTVKD